MKVLIVGGVAGGASTAARLRRLDENAEIIMFERGNHVSFANCGIPYYCGEVIKEEEKLLVQTPESLKKLLNLDVRIRSEVVSINRENKSVSVLNKDTNEQYEESYDRLVLSPGAFPIKPPLEGINDKRIFSVRNIDDAKAIKEQLKNKDIKTAAIAGGGFIGIEMAENLHELGIDVSIVEMSNQIMNQMDYEFAAQVQNHLRDKGIKLHLANGIKSFENKEKLRINLNNGENINVDLCILSIGVRPENKLAKDSGLEIGQTGGILVNKHLQTSDNNIYALGDAIEVKDLISKNGALIPLAGPANKQGRIVAENICALESKYEATQGTAIVKAFDLTVASTGNSEKALIKNNIPYLKSYTQGFSHADYYPEAFPLSIKLLFSPEGGKILGAQIIGLEGVDKRIDVIASAIRFNATIDDLVKLELAYAPPYGSAKDPINIAGMVAQNILSKKVNPIYWNEIDSLDDAYIIDVRTPVEQSLGKIEGAHNIPLEEIRNRLDEIPKDKKIVLYCTKGLKSYFASRILMQKSFENVFSLNGGFSLYKQTLQNKQVILTQNKVEQEINADLTDAIQIDACGLQCPGPIMKLSDAISKIETGKVVEIKTTDPGFKSDIGAWCNSSGNTLLTIKEENRIIKASVQKGALKNTVEKIQNEGKTLVVFSNDLDKALASFIIANGAAATGKPVTMFFTFWGLNILRKTENVKVKKSLIDKMFSLIMPKGSEKLVLSKLNMGGLGTLMMKHVMKTKNVSTLQELISQAKNQGVKFIACQMSMDIMGIKKEELIDGIEIGGVASYINAAEQADMNLFI